MTRGKASWLRWNCTRSSGNITIPNFFQDVLILIWGAVTEMKYFSGQISDSWFVAADKLCQLKMYFNKVWDY